MNSTLQSFDKVNYSPSQHKFTFGKGDRFSTPKPISQVIGYNLPSTLNKRGAGMGFGKRPETYNKEKLRGPSPETYNLKSSFDSPLKYESDHNANTFAARKKTFCFGAGREDLQIKKNLNAPGPGTYKDKSRDCGVNARKFSI